MAKEKKNRFWYSERQASLDDDVWDKNRQFTFVKTPEGYKLYSEWCSIKGTRCNWEDAELVYETDDEPEVIVHNGVPGLIADLQKQLKEKTQLAEGYSELFDKKQHENYEQFCQIKELERKLSDAEQEKERIRKNWQISKTHQQKLYNNLKQQNKAKGIVNYPITLDGCRIANEEQLLDFAKDFCLEKKYWQEQLSEKTKQVSKWKHKKAKYIVDGLHCIGEQYAIKELEKIKEFCQNSDGFNKYGQSIRVECVVDFIDCAIKDLRGEK